MAQRRRKRAGEGLFDPSSDLPALPRSSEAFSPLAQLEIEHPVSPEPPAFRVPVRYRPSIRLPIGDRFPARRLPSRVIVDYPRQVYACVQRKQRREVMFARRIAGRRGSSPGRRGGYRRTSFSSQGC